MHITLNGDAREFPLDTTVVELLDTLGYAGKRVAVERNGEIVPKSQHAQTTLADGDQIEIVVAVGGKPSLLAAPAHPRRAAATQPFCFTRPGRRGRGLMICRKRRQSMSQTRLSRNAAGRHNPQRTCVKAGRPRAGQPSMEVSRLVSRLVGQRHNKTDPGTTKREPQSISLTPRRSSARNSTAASRPTRPTSGAPWCAPTSIRRSKPAYSPSPPR